MPGQVYSWQTRSNVWVCPKCLESGWSCLYLRTHKRRSLELGMQMHLSSLSRPLASWDQRESTGIGSERNEAMEGSEGRVERMSLWMASMSTIELAWSMDVAK